MCNYLVHPLNQNEEPGQRESELYIRQTNFKTIFYVFVHILTFLRLSQKYTTKNTHEEKQMFCFAANKRVSSQQQQQIWHLPQRPIYRKIFLKNKQNQPLAGSPPCPARFVTTSKKV